MVRNYLVIRWLVRSFVDPITLVYMLEVAFKAPPSSQHQHCTALMRPRRPKQYCDTYLTLFSIFVSVSSVAWATINCGSASPLSPRAVLPLVVP